MTALITGVGGFIGQNVAEYFHDNNVNVIGTYHTHKPKCDVKKILSCDLAQEGIEAYVDEKIDAIIHFAGQMRGRKVRDYLDNTIESTRKLIDYAEHAEVKQFIYISSISVYGETVSSVNETSDRVNLDDYGMSKYLCERLLEDSQIKQRIVIRLPRVLGKGCDLSYPWLPKVTGQMLENKEVFYMNPGLMYNNVLYIDDLSKFLLLLLQNSFDGFQRFVLGAEGKMRILDILLLLREELSSTSILIEKQAENRNKCYAIDTAYAKKHGFQPGTVEEAIKNFAQDMLML